MDSNIQSARLRSVLLALVVMTGGCVIGSSRGGAEAVHEFQGRLLDVQQHLVFFTTGDAVRLAPDATITDLRSHEPVALANLTGYYARATLNNAGLITKLEVTRIPLVLDPANKLDAVAQSLSTMAPNPDLGSKQGYTGEPVLVSFTVAVPPNTPFDATVYISTEASQWDPMEIRMDRIDALHYRITRSLASGTVVTYRYTRGSWQTSERGRDGIEGAPHQFTVQNLNVARRDDVVYHWSDENLSGAQAISPDSVPTPFNNSPFVKPPTGVPF